LQIKKVDGSSLWKAIGGTSILPIKSWNTHKPQNAPLFQMSFAKETSLKEGNSAHPNVIFNN
jgi:hypothetical protein